MEVSAAEQLKAFGTFRREEIDAQTGGATSTDVEQGHHPAQKMVMIQTDREGKKKEAIGV